MHDFLLAKEIVDEVLKIVGEKKLKKVSRVDVEIGQIAMAHDGHDEHIEDISIENLKFGLEGISRNTILKDAEFGIKKIEGEHWKIVLIEGE
ncbi:MAG: hypothetical protein M0P97_01145 [Candidatus Moranbacteria bacterium]|jgi:Zn finger protein HypA/HybF involved in hydrogenase expression|nr:hypothetical protein [Candidatus Moranbacteria bacterium]